MSIFNAVLGAFVECVTSGGHEHSGASGLAGVTDR
jgi:hypothetical protein